MNGQFKFLLFRSNGKKNIGTVVSEKALRDAPQAVDDLLGFAAKGAEAIPINPTPDEAVELKIQLLKKRQAASQAKKHKKHKPAVAEVATGVVGGVAKAASKKAYVAVEHAPKGTNSKVYA